jgi:hypothetical protein
MAKVKLSALVSEIRGKLNGSVFTKNRSGLALRNKVTPVNRNTPDQSQIKALFTSFNQKWRTLSEDLQKAWNAAVQDFKRTNIFGDSFTPSGMNLYTELNTNLAVIDQPEITKPPLPVNVPGITSFTLDVDSTVGSEKFTIDFKPTPTDAGVIHMVYATRCYSAGKRYVKSEYRMIGTIAAASPTPFDALTLWTDKFGVLTKDQMVSVKLVPVSMKTGIKFKAGAELSGKVK